MDLEKNFDFQKIDIKTKHNTTKELLTGYYEPAINAFSYPKKDHILYINIPQTYI